MTQQFHSQAYIQKNWKHNSNKKTRTQMFIAELVMKIKEWKQPKSPSTGMDKQNKV